MNQMHRSNITKAINTLFRMRMKMELSYLIRGAKIIIGIITIRISRLDRMAIIG